MQNFDNDEDMSGERGCYFKDGKRRIGKLSFNNKPHTSLFMKNICYDSCALTMVDFVFLTFWQEFKIIKSFSSFTYEPVVCHSPQEAILPEKLTPTSLWKKPHPSPPTFLPLFRLILRRLQVTDCFTDFVLVYEEEEKAPPPKHLEKRQKFLENLAKSQLEFEEVRLWLNSFLV